MINPNISCPFLKSRIASTELINRIDSLAVHFWDVRWWQVAHFHSIFSCFFFLSFTCKSRERLGKRERKKETKREKHNEFSINKIVLMRISNKRNAQSANAKWSLWLIIDTMAKTPRAVINLSIFIHQININWMRVNFCWIRIYTGLQAFNCKKEKNNEKELQPKQQQQQQRRRRRHSALAHGTRSQAHERMRWG